MKITHALLKFALVAAVLTIAFRFSLSYGIANQIKVVIYLSSLVYFSVMFISGWYFGKKDKEYLPVSDLGFRFHLTTFVVFNLVTEIFYRMDLQSKVELLRDSHRTIIYWLPFLIIHFIFYLFAKRKTIKGIDKDNLFE